MSFFSRVKSIFTPTKTTSITSTTVSPTKQPSKRAVDVGTSTQDRTGSFTITSRSEEHTF